MTQVTLPPKQVQPILGTPTLSVSSAPPPALEARLKTKLADLASQALVPGKIACYGFNTPRNELQKKLIDERVTHPSNIFTMNDLNRHIQIDKNSAIIVLKFLYNNRKNLDKSSIVSRIRLYCHKYMNIPSKYSLKGKWLYFLMKNLSSIDIIGKLKDLIIKSKEKPRTYSTTPLSRLNYVTGSEVRLKEVLESFINKNNKKPLIKGLKTNDLVVKLIENLSDHPLYISSPLDKILTTALFRQTSKLGLQFFAQQKIPVAFSWETYAEGSSATGWLTQPTSSKRRQIKAFVPITGSEMRMVSSDPLIKSYVIQIKKDLTEGDVPQPPELKRRSNKRP